MSDDGNEPLGYLFSDEDRAWVRAVAPYLRQDQIARKLDIDPKTLRRHFRRELDLGEVEAHEDVGRFLLTQARESLPAAIFYAKTKMGWKEARPTDDDAAEDRQLSITGGLPDA